VHGDYQVFLGLDVGKEGHHAVALDRDGKRLHDAALVNTEARLRQVFDKLARHGPVLVVVDQPASIGALPVASPGFAAIRWPTCRVWTCAGSRTRIQARRRPTPATPT
jgi:hypothetical protein